MLTNRRVLVVEAEFLVALDIQRVLEAADAAETAFARSIDEAVGLQPRFSHFDLAIIEMPPNNSEAAISLAESLLSAGVAVVLTTTDGATAHRSPERTGVKLISRPFDETELLKACVIALAPDGRQSDTGSAGT